MPICANATRGLGTGITNFAKFQRRVAGANQPQIRGHARQQHAAGEQRQPGVNMQHGPGHSGIRQQRQPEQHARAQEKGQRAEGDDGGDLLGAEAQRGIGAIADGAAAE